MITVGILTVSDRASKGEREDASGPEIRKWAESLGFQVTDERVTSDDAEAIRQALIEMSGKGVDLLLSTGGTGLGGRDNTPEATRTVLDKEAPGFSEAIRAGSIKITPNGMLSRGVSGIRGKTIIINMPGSPKAVRESLEIIEKALPHAVQMLGGGQYDCAPQ
ncbi:MAG: MogA/MoaB family molybdenum cofactor biosynthesis protein [Leptospirales bacterium]|nr:MogA/MoaB family molybdenum cofactor biosynthesis protein [Leptospirales bacterium]